MEISRIISLMDEHKAGTLAQEIVDQCPVRILREPEPAMVMVRHTDPIEGTPFCLGEVLVTECEIEIDGKLGYGCVAGNEPVKSFLAACVDAMHGTQSSSTEYLLKKVQDEAAAVYEWEAQESSRIARTRVDFDVKKD